MTFIYVRLNYWFGPSGRAVLGVGLWTLACCECCVLSGRGLCDKLITSPEESYRKWCVVVFDLETS